MEEYFLVGLEEGTSLSVICSGPEELTGTWKCGSHSCPGSAWDINLRLLVGIEETRATSCRGVCCHGRHVGVQSSWTRDALVLITRMLSRSPSHTCSAPS